MERRRITLLGAVVGAALLAALTVGQALGTAASGTTGVPLVRADFTAQTDVQFKMRTSHGMQVVNVKGAGEVFMQQITIAPGGTTGWHTHPGPAIVAIHSGVLTITEHGKHGCESTSYTAGQAFVDPGRGHVHVGTNETSEPALLYVTYLDVPAGAGPRLDVEPAPSC